MELTIEMLASLPAPLVRSGLAGWVAAHLDAEPAVRDPLQSRLQQVVDAATDADIAQLRETFRRAGDDWRFHPADPLARDLTRTYMTALLHPWHIEGREHVGAFLAGKRRMIVCNHLSYTDTQITDCALSLAGMSEVADRLVAIAGPKVYSDPWRRMASIALNTRKTAQSSTVASEQDTLTPRELAVVALDTLADAGRLMDEGFIVLLYPEGTRSRAGRLQPFLRAAARYLAIEGVTVLPLGQVGGRELYPIDAPQMFRGKVDLRFGPPMTPRDYPGKTGALEEVHRRLAELLPQEFRPESGSPRIC